MTINTQKLRQAAASVRAFLNPGYGREISAAADIIDALEGQVAEYARLAEQTRTEADARIDAQAAEIARLRGLVAEMAEHDTYETEYDGRMYSICHGCGAQDGEPHRDPNCLYVHAQAALSGESNG